MFLGRGLRSADLAGALRSATCRLAEPAPDGPARPSSAGGGVISTFASTRATSFFTRRVSIAVRCISRFGMPTISSRKPFSISARPLSRSPLELTKSPVGVHKLASPLASPRLKRSLKAFSSLAIPGSVGGDFGVFRHRRRRQTNQHRDDRTGQGQPSHGKFSMMRDNRNNPASRPDNHAIIRHAATLVASLEIGGTRFSCQSRRRNVEFGASLIQGFPDSDTLTRARSPAMRTVAVAKFLLVGWMALSAGTAWAQWYPYSPYGTYGYGWGGWGGDSAMINNVAAGRRQDQNLAAAQNAAVQMGIRNTLSSQADARNQALRSQHQSSRDWWFQMQQQQNAERQARASQPPAMAYVPSATYAPSDAERRIRALYARFWGPGQRRCDPVADRFGGPTLCRLACAD